VRELGTSDQERELPRDKVLTSENSVQAKFTGNAPSRQGVNRPCYVMGGNLKGVLALRSLYCLAALPVR
jgi:hypothetical protein